MLELKHKLNPVVALLLWRVIENEVLYHFDGFLRFLATEWKCSSGFWMNIFTLRCKRCFSFYLRKKTKAVNK